MRSAISGLMTMATRISRKRGHTLTGKWLVDDYRGSLRATRSCACCGGWVQVIRNPAANETELGGSMVAVNCELPGYKA